MIDRGRGLGCALANGFKHNKRMQDDLQSIEPEKAPSALKKRKKLTKAEKRERKLKAAQDFKKLEISERLRVELELSQNTVKKGRQIWEDMCKDIKIVQLRQELVQWEAKAQDVMEQKDEKIALLLDEMSATEEMHKRNFSTQLQLMDYLTDTFRVFLNSAKTLYETQASEMLQDFFVELSEKSCIQERVRRNCEYTMLATNLVAEQQILADYRIYLDRRDDRVNMEIEKRYCLRNSVIDKMENLRKQLITFVDTLRNSTFDEHKYERIVLLMDRQRNFVVESQKLNVVEDRCFRLYVDLQKTLMHIDLEAQRKIDDLRLEYAYFVQLRKTIEDAMMVNRNETHEKLKILTNQSYQILTKYRNIQKYGELLLSLAASCRKLQAESEKVEIWGELKEQEFLECENEELQLQVLNLKTHVGLTEEKLLAEIKLIENFWRRQALVEAQNVLLLTKKQQLDAEHQKYIRIIKSMSKPDQIDDLPSALIVRCALPVD